MATPRLPCQRSHSDPTATGIKFQLQENLKINTSRFHIEASWHERFSLTQMPSPGTAGRFCLHLMENGSCEQSRHHMFNAAGIARQVISRSVQRELLVTVKIGNPGCVAAAVLDVEGQERKFHAASWSMTRDMDDHSLSASPVDQPVAVQRRARLLRNVAMVSSAGHLQCRRTLQEIRRQEASSRTAGRQRTGISSIVQASS